MHIDDSILTWFFNNLQIIRNQFVDNLKILAKTDQVAKCMEDILNNIYKTEKEIKEALKNIIDIKAAIYKSQAVNELEKKQIEINCKSTKALIDNTSLDILKELILKSLNY